MGIHGIPTQGLSLNNCWDVRNKSHQRGLSQMYSNLFHAGMRHATNLVFPKSDEPPPFTWYSSSSQFLVNPLPPLVMT
ncbi:unnamed protein product [Allacma fusca]|uniref:Uncharacterized protein n=1 Tax=Allacma fusca TaxID=39272 RepID=A0A8J2JYR8_9HEXA|nr:unnamed protein product [Allacma fusca]